MQDPSDWAEWVWVSAGGVLVALGYLGLVLTFRDHVPKGARRCPKCKYDMLGTPGMRCPECGQVAKNEKRLTSPVYRWRHLVWASAAVVGVVYVVIVEDRKGEGWWALVPSTYLVLVTDLSYGPPWTTQKEAFFDRRDDYWHWQCWIVLLRTEGVGEATAIEFVRWREAWPEGMVPWIEPTVPKEQRRWLPDRECTLSVVGEPVACTDGVLYGPRWPISEFHGGWAPGRVELPLDDSNEAEVNVLVYDEFGSAKRTRLQASVRLQYQRVKTVDDAIGSVDSREMTEQVRAHWLAVWDAYSDYEASLQVARHGPRNDPTPHPCVGVWVEIAVDGVVVHRERRFVYDGSYIYFRTSEVEEPREEDDDRPGPEYPLAPLDAAGKVDLTRITVRVRGDAEASLMDLTARQCWSGSFETTVDALDKRFHEWRNERAQGK